MGCSASGLSAANAGRVAENGWRVRKDGSRFYAHVVITAMTDAGGALRGFVKITQDLTEQRRQEGEREASAARFQTTVEHLLDPLAILTPVRDADGKVVDFLYEYVNAAHVDQEPAEGSGAVGHRLLELQPEADASGLLGALRKVVTTGEPLVWDTYFYESTRAGRPVRWVLDVRVAKLDDSVLVTWRNVTDRLRTEEQLAEARVQGELNQRLQASLLPDVKVDDPAMQVLARYRPGMQRALLGADFYDTLQLPDGTIAILVGDVAGHGPDEAGVGVALRVAWRTMVLTGHGGADLLAALDGVLVSERSSEEMFATVACVWVSPDRRRVTIALAGHPPPLVVRSCQASIVEVPNGVALGIGVPGETWESTTLALGAQWLLLCYTDGLIEGRQAPDTAERFGAERLAETVTALSGERTGPGELLDRLLRAVQEANGGQLSDDVAIVCAVATGSGRRRQD